MRHIDESAELYALGMLEESEAAFVLAHARDCPACTRLLTSAQQIVASLDEGAPQYEPSSALRERIVASAGAKRFTPGRWVWFSGGLVAGLAAAALVLFPARIMTGNAVPRDDLALTTIVQSHFNHVSFVALQKGAPQAKALYGKHLEWIYVVVHEPQPGLQIEVERPRGGAVIAPIAVSGENGTAFIRAPGQVKQIELLQSGRVVSRAVPVTGP